ncbi:MAG: P63C domain-containing protein, partial [Methylococcaceae bacterium]|nr:P63C domain-containing protein [Methylococcaceae bacterium]
EILNELQKKNPIENGRRKHKHHQYLTEDVGHPELQNHLWMVIGLMRVSANWDKFIQLLDKACTRFNDTIPLDFNEEI